MRVARDIQRSKVYRCEDEIGDGRWFRGAEHAAAFALRVTRSAWWRERFGEPDIGIVVRPVPRPRRFAKAWCFEVHGRPIYIMELPDWALCQRVVLHELAHCVTRHARAAHGPEFAAAYLDLVSEFRGAGVARRLERAYQRHAVVYADGAESS